MLRLAEPEDGSAGFKTSPGAWKGHRPPSPSPWRGMSMGTQLERCLGGDGDKIHPKHKESPVCLAEAGLWEGSRADASPAHSPCQLPLLGSAPTPRSPFPTLGPLDSSQALQWSPMARWGQLGEGSRLGRQLWLRPLQGWEVWGAQRKNLSAPGKCLESILELK